MSIEEKNTNKKNNEEKNKEILKTSAPQPKTSLVKFSENEVKNNKGNTNESEK